MYRKLVAVVLVAACSAAQMERTSAQARPVAEGASATGDGAAARDDGARPGNAHDGAVSGGPLSSDEGSDEGKEAADAVGEERAAPEMAGDKPIDAKGAPAARRKVSAPHGDDEAAPKKMSAAHGDDEAAPASAAKMKSAAVGEGEAAPASAAAKMSAAHGDDEAAPAAKTSAAFGGEGSAGERDRGGLAAFGHGSTGVAMMAPPAALRDGPAPGAPMSRATGRFEAIGGSVAGELERAPRSAEVKAASTDDNQSFGAFEKFLARSGRLALPDPVGDRIVVEVKDAAGAPIFGASVVATDLEGHVIARRRTYPDGRALVFAHGAGTLRISSGAASETLSIAGPATREVQLDTRRSEVSGKVPLDIAFVLDTTGSMGDEIDRLRSTLVLIHHQLTHLDPGADVRFGLVEYKDHGDEFVTRAIPFTSDVAAFRAALNRLQAGGGGDEPEDVQAGLEQALHKLKWRDENAVKVAFLIGDAPPHLDYGETFTYLDAAKEAARRGIKIAAVGCSGLNMQGEVVWREIAQQTMAPYLFLTRGERGDMEGSASTVSHHTGNNYASENLETLVVRMVKHELAPLSPRLVASK